MVYGGKAKWHVLNGSFQNFRESPLPSDQKPVPVDRSIKMRVCHMSANVPNAHRTSQSAFDTWHIVTTWHSGPLQQELDDCRGLLMMNNLLS
jgi:hypothetical protein